ncbi:MAG TPA: succinylglutamate desuccinylase/aspartoacylase family protein [Ilumatobacteraceae bacterium]|nr:succinylglutamate desuccinylase/aspartoacylase family protein [Ilumatobacteraceae bacterium]
MTAGIATHDLGEGWEVSVFTALADNAGPIVSILGGVHGDELEGVAAARMLMRRCSAGLLTGGVRIVDVSNPSAFSARTRRSPVDGGDLARSFPGRPDGSLTERVADVLHRAVLAGSDLLIDLHSAGSAYAMPLFAGCLGGDGAIAQQALAAATAFAAPLGWIHDEIGPGRSISAANEDGIPAIYVEGGGGGALTQTDLHGYVHGTERVLSMLGVLDTAPPAVAGTRWIRGGDGDVDAMLSTTVDGWCVTSACVGQTVSDGDPLAAVIDEHGEVVEVFTAHRDGTVMMLRRLAEVAAGDGIVMVGPLAEAVDQ